MASSAARVSRLAGRDRAGQPRTPSSRRRRAAHEPRARPRRCGSETWTRPSRSVTSVTSAPVTIGRGSPAATVVDQPAGTADDVAGQTPARVPDECEVAGAVTERDLVQLGRRPGDGRAEERVRVAGERAQPVAERAVVAVREHAGGASRPATPRRADAPTRSYAATARRSRSPARISASRSPTVSGSRNG